MKKRALSMIMGCIMPFLMHAQTDLFGSCLKGDLAGVKQAVESGVNINNPDPKSGQNALAYAFFYPDIVAYLLEQGCDPNGGSYPALVSASSVASYDVMQLLLEHGADPNKTGASETPLLKVVQMTNCTECARLLLEKGADKNTTTSSYGNLVGVYASYGLPQNERKEAMVKYAGILKNYGLTVPDWYTNPSARMNETPGNLLKVLLDQGLDINMREKNIVNPKAEGQTPLFTAMNVGKQEVIMSLLENGADYNAKYDVIDRGFTYWSASDGYTALMYACVKGYADAVKWIVSKPDVVNHSVSGQSISNEGMIFNFEGLSALYIAIMNNDMETVKALAESGMAWGDLVFKALPGQKFESSYGSKPEGKLYTFGTFGSKKGDKQLIFTPSLYAKFLEQTEMADYLSSKGI